MWKPVAVELTHLEGAQVGGQLRAGSGVGLDFDESFQSGKNVRVKRKLKAKKSPSY